MRKVIAAYLLLVAGCVPESKGGYFDDTTIEMYKEIKIGMSYDQVYKITGKGGEELSRVEGACIICWKNPNGSNMVITFHNGEVFAKAQFGLSPETAEARATKERLEASKKAREKAWAKAEAEANAKEAARKQAMYEAMAKVEAKARAEIKARNEAEAKATLAKARKAIEEQPRKPYGDVDLLTDTVRAERSKVGTQRLSGTVANTRSDRRVRVVVSIAMRDGKKTYKTEQVTMYLRPGESKQFFSDEHSSTFKLEVVGVVAK
jgi:hypothetical protein